MARRGGFIKQLFMTTNIMDVASKYPQVSITVNATDLEKFGVELLSRARAVYEAEIKSKVEAENDRTLLTAKEVAAFFSVSTRTVTRWRKAGYLTPVSVGGILKYRRIDCKRLIDEGRA